MAHPSPQTPVILSREEYRRWAEAQPRGRYELVAGEVVAMAPERVAHIRVKARVWLALDRAVRAAGLPCPVCGDTVKSVSFADRSFQYCPTCQTEGRELADRRLSKLLK